jgi:Protein O-mannosyl-transferase TMEM260-like
MNFRKVNNITGWIILLIATATYTLTREATASFWDCGEFIACANEIGIPHPPGSPLFTMLGRLFIIVFSGGDAANAASSVNLMSAVASGFCVLFLFWTITHFARKMFVNHGENLTAQQTFTVMASGVVGALAYTFSDTFWFSAVEGEVYALSSFFTALIIWAMLKWEHAYELAKDVVERNRADRWIVFIFFMLGLSITVHLLNLLTLPAIVMIYFYKKYTPTVRKSIFAFLFSCLLTGAILFGMVYAIPRTSAAFDRLFVNGFGLPFFTGFTFFFILLGALLWFLLKVARDKGMPMLRLAVWCFVFVMIGYSTYVTTLIRSNANPGIDMSNVDNPATLASYFAREQYGSAPLLYGTHFGSQPAIEGNYYKFKEGRMKWGKLGNKYVELGREQEYDYDASQLMVFPRIWDGSEQQDHLQFYISWLNKSPYQDETGRVSYDPKITYGDNFNFFFSYQMGLMYWRYFMWNFSGRQNDLQGFGNRRDGNWQTGISFIDKQMLGDQSTLPDSLKENKANNKLYLLPFLLGILGCVYHFIKKKNDWVVNFLLFFFTGIAIGLFLNMPGNQPRERDYAFVGSFYAFAVWIGLAVTALVKLTKEIKQNSFNTIVYGSVLTFLISVFSMTYLPGSAVIKTSLMITAIYAILAAGLPALLKAISSKGANERILNIAAAVICMLAPILMANQEWDDHDRSKKTLARDDAKNYLESCAPNAILFCFGDNDTYPLWYAQEVEKVRPDIRIINTSLLGIDWYINQLRYKINQSDSVDVIWRPDQIIGDKLQYLQYMANDKVPQDQYYPLYDVMKNVLGNQADPRFLPVKRFKVPVDTALVRKNGTLNEEDVAATEMQFEIPNRALTRDQLIILNVIATNQWKRPIYFTSQQVGMGLTDFMRRDGLTFRLIPIRATTDVNVKPMYENMMKKFTNGHADVKGVYFDEENRRHLYQIRQSYADLARELLAKGEKDSAKAVVLKSDQLIPNTNAPYGIPSRYEGHNRASWLLMDAAYQSGATALAKKISDELNKDMNQHLEYLASLGDMTKKQLEDILMNYSQQKYMEQMQQQQGGQPGRQADAYLNANLSRNQSGLAVDMIQLFNLMQYVKRTDADYNPAAKDTLKKKLDSPLSTLDADTNNLKGNADSPKATKPK